jgi:hypothetical protein
MTHRDEALRDLSALLVAVEPFGPSVVLAGGFAAWMYRFVEPYDPSGPELHTLDIDYAVPSRLPHSFRIHESQPSGGLLLRVVPLLGVQGRYGVRRGGLRATQ